MTITGFLKTSGLSALAAALAITALPAEAFAAEASQRGGGWQDRSGNREARRDNRSQRSERQARPQREMRM